MDAEGLLQVLEAPGPVERRAGDVWIRPERLDVRAMARRMHDHGVRLVTLTARPEPTGGLRIIYHWDAGSTVLHVWTTAPLPSDGVPSDGVPTIADIVPGADWAEREIRDYYGLEFGGRVSTRTLMLREGDPAGLFTRTAEVGRATDPARTARAAAEATDGEPR